jgi:dTDP-4-dehydrorhamnose 3,5-epimerase
MIVSATAIPGPFVLELEPQVDKRGFFARTFCRQEFISAGLEPLVDQCNIAYNHRAGTLRGMHYQVEPAPEAKLVRCTRGAILDVIIDVRAGSPNWLQHVAVPLSANNRRAVYVPPLFAHGYVTLTDDTEVCYQVSAAYQPEAERGLRYDDVALGLSWPVPIAVVSDKDRSWPLLPKSQAQLDGR